MTSCISAIVLSFQPFHLCAFCLKQYGQLLIPCLKLKNNESGLNGRKNSLSGCLAAQFNKNRSLFRDRFTPQISVKGGHGKHGLWSFLPLCGNASPLTPRRTYIDRRNRNDKSRTFPRLPVRFTQQGYGCLLDFTAFCQLIHLLRLAIGFLFVGPRFRYGFFSPALHSAKLASRYWVRWQLRPLGLPPKLRNMPVIQKRLSMRKVFRTNGKRTGNPPPDFETDG